MCVSVKKRVTGWVGVGVGIVCFRGVAEGVGSLLRG